jgi:methylenetetrahydrofolate reductase (NADPH)
MPELLPATTQSTEKIKAKKLDHVATNGSATNGNHSNGVSAHSPTACRPDSPSVFGHVYERLIDRIYRRKASGDKFFSLEFFPARTASGAVNLISRYM